MGANGPQHEVAQEVDQAPNEKNQARGKSVVALEGIICQTGKDAEQQ